MDFFSAVLAMQAALAVVLFFLINWIGKHSVDFGYVSTSLFEEPNESLALNFFIRALFPTVFIIVAAAAFVYVGRPDLRLDIVMVVPYYFLIRASVIFLFNRHRLISWTRYLGHAFLGTGISFVAYNHLILPNRSLLPDLETAGNELWLALFAFLYAVANKVSLSTSPAVRRRNMFVSNNYSATRLRYGDQIEARVPDELLKLIVCSVLVYEDYCRPPAIRVLERLAFWKDSRTTGVMQVTASVPLSDDESVDKGIDILATSWDQYADEEYKWRRVRKTISDYNKDSDYVGRVMDVMEILAKRTDRSFEPAYDSIWDD